MASHFVICLVKGNERRRPGKEWLRTMEWDDTWVSGQIGEWGIDTKLCVRFEMAEAWMEKNPAGKIRSRIVIVAGGGFGSLCVPVASLTQAPEVIHHHVSRSGSRAYACKSLSSDVPSDQSWIRPFGQVLLHLRGEHHWTLTYTTKSQLNLVLNEFVWHAFLHGAWSRFMKRLV